MVAERAKSIKFLNQKIEQSQKRANIKERKSSMGTHNFRQKSTSLAAAFVTRS